MKETTDVPTDAATLLAGSLATIVYNTLNHYWFSSADSKQAFITSFKDLGNILVSQPEIIIKVQDKDLMVGDKLLLAQDRKISAFIQHLKDIELLSSSLAQGLGEEEFAKFAELIATTAQEIKKSGGVNAAIERLGFGHVHIRKVVLRDVGDNDSAPGAKPGQAPDQDPGTAQMAGDILAFLKGDIAVGDARITEAVRKIASDPEKMADLIMRAAELKERPPEMEKAETLSDFVVGFLRRAYNQLSNDKAVHTKTGNQALRKTLLLLEKKVVDRMRASAQEQCTPEQIDAISATVSEMVNGLKVQGVAEEYMGKMNALAECEKKIVGLMKSAPAGSIMEESIHGQLRGQGLDFGEWNRLAIKSGKVPAGDMSMESSRIMDAIKNLETLLESIEKQAGQAEGSEREKNAEKMLAVLDDIQGQVKTLTHATLLTIKDLVTGLRADEPVVAEAEARLLKASKGLLFSRHEVLAILVKVVKDVSEPLAMIKSSLDLMGSRTFGRLSEFQTRALAIANTNADIIGNLLSNLERISAHDPAQKP